MFRAFGTGRGVAGLLLFTVIACSTVAGGEPPPSLGIMLVGGYSQATGSYASSDFRGVHVGGGLQARLSCQRSYAFSLVVRADYYDYSINYVSFVHDPAPRLSGHRSTEGSGSLEADLVFTLLNGSVVHPYGLAGLGVRELSGMVCVGIGGDLTFASSDMFAPFVEFRFSKADLSSVQFDFGVRLGK